MVTVSHPVVFDSGLVVFAPFFEVVDASLSLRTVPRTIYLSEKPSTLWKEKKKHCHSDPRMPFWPTYRSIALRVRSVCPFIEHQARSKYCIFYPSLQRVHAMDGAPPPLSLPPSQPPPPSSSSHSNIYILVPPRPFIVQLPFMYLLVQRRGTLIREDFDDAGMCLIAPVFVPCLCRSRCFGLLPL